MGVGKRGSMYVLHIAVLLLFQRLPLSSLIHLEQRDYIFCKRYQQLILGARGTNSMATGNHTPGHERQSFECNSSSQQQQRRHVSAKKTFFSVPPFSAITTNPSNNLDSIGFDVNLPVELGHVML